MNNQSQTKKRNIKLIAKNGSIHIGLVEEHQASPAPTDTIQLELDFNKTTTDYH